MSATIATEPTGPLSMQLQERLAAALARAQQLLGDDREPSGLDQPERLRDLIARLTALSGSQGDGATGAAVADQQAALERLRRRYGMRFEALEAVRGAIAGLRAITAPAEMLARAPAALAGASRLHRVLLSLTAEGRLVAEAAHLDGARGRAAEVVKELRAEPVRLEHPLIETELLRRRRATIVDEADVHPRVDRRLVEALGTRSYAAAPLVVGPHVVGMLHAGRADGERLDVLDRDVLWEFTSLLAQAYESAGLRRALRHEREQTREFLSWLGARSGELTEAPIRLATLQRPAQPPPAAPAPPAGPAAGGRDDRVVFEGLLTRRELDVLRLLADGNSNKRIAEVLVISDGTVKFHVNSILRKLRVANRAEAVSRYLRLLGMRSP